MMHTQTTNSFISMDRIGRVYLSVSLWKNRMKNVTLLSGSPTSLIDYSASETSWPSTKWICCKLYYLQNICTIFVLQNIKTQKTVSAFILTHL